MFGCASMFLPFLAWAWLATRLGLPSALSYIVRDCTVILNIENDYKTKPVARWLYDAVILH